MLKTFIRPVNARLNNRGMTLIEIMIVLVIVGGLAAILGGNLIGSLGKANKKEAVIAMKEIGKQLDMFYTDCGYYPQGLDALTEADANCKNWGPEPYLKKSQLKDPWRNDYIYTVEGSTYALKSLGADRKEGGSGNDADISSEEN